MGRILSGPSTAINSLVTATKIAPAGYMGEFGNGLWRIFRQSGTFTVPEGVEQIRVRVLGAGGRTANGAAATQIAGAGGGGYAHGIFAVTPGDDYAVTVPQQNTTAGSAGGTASFGALISATGGQPGAGAVGGVGGEGIGGDFQARGGKAGDAGGSGGGGAGSQLGDGGGSLSTKNSSGGGIVGDGTTTHGGSPFGSANIAGAFATDSDGNEGSAIALSNPIGAVLRFPFDGFTGGGAYGNATGGIGGGGGSSSGASGGGGGIGGGGGGGGGSGGDGGLGGGGGGDGDGGNSTGDGGAGLVIVEW